MDIEQVEAFRREKDEFFKASAYSPLTPEQQAVFTGLDYYDPNPALDLVITIRPFDDPGDMTLETTTGDRQVYRRYGEFTFEVEGQQARLTLFAGGGSYFLPFVDANAGKETYPAGRYLEPEPLGNNRFRVDFNQAYNPYCAYNEPYSLAAQAGRLPVEWSCPITPKENRLSVPIRAGEKLPKGAWVEPLSPLDEGAS